MAKKSRPDVQLAKFVRIISDKVKEISEESLRDRTNAWRAARVVLDDIQRTNPTYNNYSGNLNRSYMATISAGGDDYVITTDPNDVPKPQISRSETYGRYSDASDYQVARMSFKPGYNPFFKKRRYFYLTVKRHGKTRSYRSNKDRKKWNTRWKRVIKNWEHAGMHQYSGNERVPFGTGGEQIRTGVYRGKRSKNRFFMQISNRTPYSESVEKAGYTVINLKKQLKYQNMVAKMIGEKISASLDNFAKEYKRDARGRFTR